MEIGTSTYDYILSQYKDVIERSNWRSQSNFPLDNVLYELLSKRNISESTNQTSINIQNFEFLQFLRSKEVYFITLLHRCDFEDGVINDSITFIQQNLQINKSVTCNWMNELYGKFIEDKLVLCGILRIIAFLHITHYESTFIPMILASLRDSSTDCQEAALMLIEVIRTPECIDAIKNTEFSSPWIKEYADNVLEELELEIGSNVNKKN